MINLKHIIFNYDKVIFLAPNDIQEYLEECNNCGIDAIAIDYDPKFSRSKYYLNKDFVFDDVDLNADLIVHKNIEKTYPIKFNPGTDVILIGDNDGHNGDCIPIMDADTIIRLYNIKKVYEKGFDEDETHYYVYGQV